jgi:hypothetical protein
LILSIITSQIQNAFLYGFKALFVGLVYGVLVTLSRAKFYIIQNANNYNKTIVVVNLVESIGQVLIKTATAYLVNSNFMISGLVLVFLYQV